MQSSQLDTELIQKEELALYNPKNHLPTSLVPLHGSYLIPYPR